MNGTNQITRVFQGVVSQTSDTQAAIQEIHNQNFPVLSVKHEMSLTNPKGTRTVTRTCTFGTTVTCSTVAESTHIKFSASATVNKADKSESGGGTLTHKKSHKNRNITITINADGSTTRTITNPSGVTVTLIKAADGTVSGTVTKDGNTLVTIGANATSGDFETTDGSASESSDKADDDPT